MLARAVQDMATALLLTRLVLVTDTGLAMTATHLTVQVILLTAMAKVRSAEYFCPSVM